MIVPKYYALREYAPKSPPMPRNAIEAILQEERTRKERKHRVVLELSRAMKVPGTIRGPAPKCPICHRFIGPLEWRPPYRVEIETWGTAFGDLMFMSGNDLLVSDAFRHIYELNELRGPSDYEEVKVEKVIKHRKLSGDLPKYFKLAVPLGPARIDQRASKYLWTIDESPCPHCLWPKSGVSLKSYERLVVEENTWASQDIFRAHGCSRVSFIVTERFKNACEENAIKNVEFEALESCAWEKPAREL